MEPSLYGHLLAGLSCECLVVPGELNRFLSVYVDDVKNVKKKAARMVGTWTRLQNKVGSEDPASLLDQVYLGCTQRAAWTNQRIVASRTSFESVVSAGIANVQPGKEQATTNTTSSSYDIEGHAKKRVQHYCG